MRSVDFNVPFADGKISNNARYCAGKDLLVSAQRKRGDSSRVSPNPSLLLLSRRIVGALESIKYALSQGAKSVVCMSHLGRPNGQANETFTLAPVAKELEVLLGDR